MVQKQVNNSSIEHSAREGTRKRKRRHLFGRGAAVLICFLTGILCAYKLNAALFGYQSETLLTNISVSGTNQLLIPTGDIPETNLLISDLPINSANAVLMDFEKGDILFDKNRAAKMYPASMTKIMTAIVALEHIKDIDDKVLLNDEMFKLIYNANAATAGFLQGEYVRAIDLLYGLLLPSGAECAIGLAEYVAGSERGFVGLMNEKAREIGMGSSNFVNATGLHDNNHYSTAMDMAVLFRYALSNDVFYEIVTSQRYSTPATNRHDGGITFYSTVFSRIDSPKFSGGSILGGKTGFTDEAGQCLASLAVKDSCKYILVTSGAVGNNQKQELHIEDAFVVYTAINK